MKFPVNKKFKMQVKYICIILIYAYLKPNSELKEARIKTKQPN